MDKLKILVADDDKSVRGMLKEHLTQLGYDVETCEDGEEALNKARQIAPDLLILDVHMPKMDGRAVGRELKKDEKFRHIPIILIAATIGGKDLAKALQEGVDDFIVKPFNLYEVDARVKSHIRTKKLYEEVAHKNRELIEARKSRDTAIQMLVHDMKNPLTGINGYIELAQGVLGKDKVLADKYLSTARRNVKDMLDLIQDILNINAAEEGKLRLKKEKVEIPVVLDEIKVELGSLILDRKISFTSEISSDMPTLSTDRNILRRSFINLIANAIKHSFDGGKIKFKALYDEISKKVYFYVIDEGEGIPREYLDKVFEKFAVAN